VVDGAPPYFTTAPVTAAEIPVERWGEDLAERLYPEPNNGPPPGSRTILHPFPDNAFALSMAAAAATAPISSAPAPKPSASRRGAHRPRNRVSRRVRPRPSRQSVRQHGRRPHIGAGTSGPLGASGLTNRRHPRSRLRSAGDAAVFPPCVTPIGIRFSHRLDHRRPQDIAGPPQAACCGRLGAPVSRAILRVSAPLVATMKPCNSRAPQGQKPSPN
jgi:hypothetical protein